MTRESEIFGSVALPDGAHEWVASYLPESIESAEVINATQRSTVVRLRTDGRVCFFKADHILPPAEAIVIGRLAPRWPNHIVPVIALDEARGWSLSEDAGRTGLDDANTDDWCRLVDRFGRVQQATGLSADEWVALGCRDLRGERLFSAIDAMLADCRSEVGEKLWSRIESLRPKISEACNDLANDGIPATLVHQDLVPVNIILRDGVPVFLDWSDTVIGHPFFGCDRLLDSCWNEPERKAAVIDAYLGAFEGVVSEERLRASFKRVLWLRVLYEDVRWHHEIAELDPESEPAQRLGRDMIGGVRMVAEHQK